MTPPTTAPARRPGIFCVRDGTAEAAAAQLLTGTSVHVVGLRASGRSHTVDHVAHELALRGWGAYRVRALGALRDRPLAALAVAGVEVSPAPATAAAIAQASQALAERLTPGHTVLAIDDVEELDPASWGVVIAAHLATGVPVLTTGRPGVLPSDDAAGAWPETAAALRLTLPPLRYDAVHALMQSVLPGVIDPATVARVALKSGGLPGLVLPLVAETRRAGRLQERSGRWVAEDDLWLPTLAGLAEPFLAGLPVPALDAVRLLSLAGPVVVGDAQRLVPPEVLVDLEERGLLHVMSGAAGPVLAVFPPLLADFVRAELPALRRLDLVARLEAVVGRAPRPGVDGSGLQTGLTPAATGRDDPAGTVLPRLVHDHWAVQLAVAREAWQAAPTPAAAVPYLAALHQITPDPAEVERVLAGTARGEDADSAMVEVWQAMHRALTRHDLRGAREGLHAARRALPRFDGLFRGVEGHLELVLERVPEPALLADPGADEHPLALEAVRTVRAAALAAAGRGAEALALVEDLEPTSSYFRGVHGVARSVGLLVCGDVDGAIRHATTGCVDARRALDVGSIASQSYGLALGLTLAGRLADLADHASQVIALAHAPTMQRHYQVGLLTLAVMEAAASGRMSYGRSLAVRARSIGAHAGPLPGMMPDLAFAMIRSAAGDPDGVAAEVWSGIEDRAARGYVTAAVLHAGWAVDLDPAAGRAQRLAAMIAPPESETLRLVLDYAVARETGDLDTLLQVARRCRRLGLALYDARATLAAVRGLRARGLPAEAAQEAASGWHAQRGTAEDRRRLFGSLLEDADLSAREREVAELVANGMTNHAIATALHLSVRTVDNHVLSVFRKVGVDNRDRLAAAMRSWLSTD